MQHYVCGFLIDQRGEFVALIEKNHPDWQKGKLNGIGGKVQSGETPHEAMAREFKEEAGADIPADKWRWFATLVGKDYRVFNFICRRNINISSMTDEKVAYYNLNGVLGFGELNVIHDIKWLIPLGMLDSNLEVIAKEVGVSLDPTIQDSPYGSTHTVEA